MCLCVRACVCVCVCVRARARACCVCVRERACWDILHRYHSHKCLLIIDLSMLCSCDSTLHSKAHCSRGRDRPRRCFTGETG